MKELSESLVNTLQWLVRYYGKISANVLGNSMWPILHDGQKVLITVAETYKTGDIVAYFIGKKLVIHRIYACSQTMFVAKGDNKVAMDPCSPMSDILGLVKLPVPRKYLHGLYRYPCSIVNKTVLPFQSHLATGVGTNSFQVERNLKFVIAICTSLSNCNWVRPLEIHLECKIEAVSYLEFHIIDDPCAEKYLSKNNGIEYDSVLGLGDPILYDSLDDEQKGLYLSGQVSVIRQFIETRIGEKRYGQSTQLS